MNVNHYLYTGIKNSLAGLNLVEKRDLGIKMIFLFSPNLEEIMIDRTSVFDYLKDQRFPTINPLIVKEHNKALVVNGKVLSENTSILNINELTKLSSLVIDILSKEIAILSCGRFLKSEILKDGDSQVVMKALFPNSPKEAVSFDLNFCRKNLGSSWTFSQRIPDVLKAYGVVNSFDFNQQLNLIHRHKGDTERKSLLFEYGVKEDLLFEYKLFNILILRTIYDRVGFGVPNFSTFTGLDFFKLIYDGRRSLELSSFLKKKKINIDKFYNMKIIF